MATEKSQQSTPSASVSAPVAASCRRKKSEDASFLQDVKDHIDEFIHASTDEHKTCFQKTILKVCFSNTDTILLQTQLFNDLTWFKKA
ncbi:hypothetical protein HanRHA438_Chr10g0465721 [Helianthus annuus]|nr:hypothetical protein HanHA300_Chr10g0372171 [Helianthus annuus]KAJ0880660.1 hypothetical protein HanRHA438_Chr10g0465721 [Helianthus annuus]